MKKVITIAITAAFFLLLAAWWYLQRPPLAQVLVFSKTAEYRHDSIAAGIAALTEVAGEHRIAVVATEDAEIFSQTELQQFQAVVFLNTTGMVLARPQQEALERYIQAGGGFVGIHAAADTHWKANDWPWYTRLLGAAFLSHPSDPSNVQSGLLQVADSDSELTAMFPAAFEFTDEWYDYQRLSDKISVLLRIDENTYQGGRMGAEHPVAWYQNFDGGRSFYTNFGHRPESFSDPAVREHLWAGLAWAMGDGQLDYSKARPESWRMKRVILDSGLNEPMAMAFTPASELYFIQRRGELLRYDPQLQRSVEVARFEVTDEGEYGLIGFTFDPDYSSNQWLYIFRNVLVAEGAAYRLSRYRLAEDGVEHASEQVILEIPTEAGRQNHTGGTLVFGPQGNLWISTGDTTNPHESGGFSPHDDRPGRAVFDAARSAGNTKDLRGKILRISINSDGSYGTPEDNLFTDAANGRPEIFAMGLRNPFRFDVDSRTGILYWGEVGPDSRDYSGERGPWGYDEFNRTNKAGNFGWPFVIGYNEPYAYYDFGSAESDGMVDPAAPQNRSRNNTGARVLPPAQPAWMRYPYTLEEGLPELGEGGRSAMAGQVYYHDDYPPNPLKLPPYYDGKLFIYEWVRHWVQAVSMDDDGGVRKIEPLLEPGIYSAPIHLKFAPDGSLYVLEYGSAWFSPNDDAYLSRIEYYGDDNPPPVVLASADERVGAVPFSTTLRGSQSFDRNGSYESLSFSWDQLKNGRVVQHIADTADASFSADTAGDYQLQLTVTDADGVSSESGVLLQVGNDRPQIDIAFSNGNGSVFWDDVSVDYQVTVTDTEDGSTRDGGIADERVRVSVEYVPQGKDIANAELGHQAIAGPDGWQEIEASDCLSCHMLDAASVGPSFNELRSHYAGKAGAVSALAEKIQQGGQGVWGDYAMPGHPQLSVAQTSAMAEWIMERGQAQAAAGLPLSGTLNFERHQNDSLANDMVGKLYTGRYLLMASYEDRGAVGARTARAAVTRVLMPPVVDPTAADARSDAIMQIPVPMEGSEDVTLALYLSREGQPAYLLFEDFDLSEIRSVKLGIATSSLITSGGSLNLRLGSPDGRTIGTHHIENKNLGMPETLDYYGYDVSDIEGRFDVYLTTDPAGGEAAKPEFILGTIEFVR
ncbi:cytochrome C [Halieaceae bacterium IMCC14734]|uniref:Cytochrome c-551 n=1 Tax=Candidatus Litorirhabdus singularis TaxID=2518993 RepID=A0ABT3TCU2_9GAMM|nr:ThuA domain-containing protein [Candidatus Litorirhabdus singularis]MCX2980107.1 cytochrome C [Candidatus Litorirhabdus singularis]